MIKAENIIVSGFDAAIRGMRNPLQSWSKSDSVYCHDIGDCPANCPYAVGSHECTGPINPYLVGSNDLDLARRLFQGGTEHRKFMRMIHVSMDIKAPDFWFKEFSTYRVGVTENSTSTMHTISKKPFTMDDFSMEHMPKEVAEEILRDNEARRQRYIDSKDYNDWRCLIEGLPMSYNYLRTVDFNYENAVTMIRQRENHKLEEWREFVAILKDLPYIREITGCDEK